MTYLKSVQDAVNELIDVGSVTSLRTGFEDQPLDDKYELLFVDATRLLTLQPKAPETEFNVYYQNIKFTINSAKTITISTTNGLHYIYYDVVTGLLGETTTFDVGIILGTNNRVFVSVVYWNNTAGYAPIVAIEGHTVARNLIWHLFTHTTFGARYDAGGLISGYTLNNSANTAITFQMQDLDFYDEDLYFRITNGTPSNDLSQDLRIDRSGVGLDTLAQLPILHREGAGGVWTQDAPVDYAYKWDGTRLTVNQDLGGGSWGQVQVSQTDFCSVFIIGTNDTRNPIKVIQGQTIYATLADAQAGFATEIANLGDFPSAEVVLLYRILLQTRTTYSNARNARVVDVQQALTSQVPGGNVQAIFDHPTGTNLDYSVAGHTDFQRVFYEYAGVPTANFDSVDTAGIGIEFKKSDMLNNTILDDVYICCDATATTAVWKKITP